MSKTLKAIENAIESRQGKGFRRHLGASIVGHPCARYGWYIFRWARRSRFTARLLRLFDRGNREEDVLIRYLQQAGVIVYSKNPETGDQFRIEDHHGHFGGSLDSILQDTPDFPRLRILGEYKTHNEKRFNELKKERNKLGDDRALEKTNTKYHAQAHLYMHYGLQLGYLDHPACLHFNVCKNDDDIAILTLEYKPEVAERYIDRAYKIIHAQQPPIRISESPAWYVCSMCDFRYICHNMGEQKDKNCRTCVFSRPIENAQWICERYNYVLNEAEQARGCQTYTAIPE